MKKQMTLAEIKKNLFGPETRTAEQSAVNQARIVAEETGDLDIFRMFGKTHFQYLNEREKMQVCRVVKKHLA